MLSHARSCPPAPLLRWYRVRLLYLILAVSGLAIVAGWGIERWRQTPPARDRVTACVSRIPLGFFEDIRNDLRWRLSCRACGGAGPLALEVASGIDDPAEISALSAPLYHEICAGRYAEEIVERRMYRSPAASGMVAGGPDPWLEELAFAR